MLNGLLYGYDEAAWAAMIQWWIRSQPGVALPDDPRLIDGHWDATRGDHPGERTIDLSHLTPWRLEGLKPSKFCRWQARKYVLDSIRIGPLKNYGGALKAVA